MEKQSVQCEIDFNHMKELDQFIDELALQGGNLDGKLIAILHKAQEIVGYLPPEVQGHIASRLSIPPAKVFGVVTFYSFFTMIPKGKYAINVCMGTACFVVGAEAILNELKKQLGINPGETTADRMFSLNALRCVGACGLAPLVLVNDKLYGRITIADVKKIIDECKEREA